MCGHIVNVINVQQRDQWLTVEVIFVRNCIILLGQEIVFHALCFTITSAEGRRGNESLYG